MLSYLFDDVDRHGSDMSEQTLRQGLFDRVLTAPKSSGYRRARLRHRQARNDRTTSFRGVLPERATVVGLAGGTDTLQYALGNLQPFSLRACPGRSKISWLPLRDITNLETGKGRPTWSIPLDNEALSDNLACWSPSAPVLSSQDTIKTLALIELGNTFVSAFDES